MKRKIGNGCMLLGAALLLAALSLLLWNREEDRQAGAQADAALPKVVERILAGSSTEDASYPDPYDPAMTHVEIDGYGYIGYLSIPSIALDLPVMADWDYDRLKIAPCRYTGSTKTGDLVICAHNYEKHFGLLRELTPGDRVYFTDMDGVIWEYEVAAVDILSPTAMEEMSSGEYDLTLFTCTYGGENRVTARCDRIKDG